MKAHALTLTAAVVLTACATSPLGRPQLKFFPQQEMAQMGVAAFDQVKQEKPELPNGPTTEYVRCVADAITAQLPSGHQQWDVEVFKDSQPNAFALPGGKIGVYTGIMNVAKNQSQLATVLGHEIAHVEAGHPNERVSTTYATQAGLDLIGAIADGGTESKQISSLLGIGAQVGFLLPFNRTQEREADLYGLDLMARAGFDPRQSVAFWQNMEKAGTNGPPEFLSTHPSGTTRVHDLEDRMNHAMQLYQQAQQAGLHPSCQPPG